MFNIILNEIRGLARKLINYPHSYPLKGLLCKNVYIKVRDYPCGDMFFLGAWMGLGSGLKDSSAAAKTFLFVPKANFTR